MTAQDNLAEAVEKLAQGLERDANRIGGDWGTVLNAASRCIRELLQLGLDKAEVDLAEARETIKRLNRRVQVAEAGVAEKVKASAPGSLGRALANAAASKAEVELAALKAKITESARVQWVGAYCGENSYAEFKEPREGYQIYAVVALTEPPAERGEE